MRVRTCVITCCALVLLGVLTATAAATPLDKRTTFTFSAPFTVPGVTLPAGTYVFRLADDLRGRDIVQVLGAENETAYAMFHTLRTPRGTPVDKPELRFMETAADKPLAVKSWWYPAETQGYEFLYPRHQAELLAKGIGAPVVAEAPAAGVLHFVLHSGPTAVRRCTTQCSDCARDTAVEGAAHFPVALREISFPRALNVLRKGAIYTTAGQIPQARTLPRNSGEEPS